MLTDSNTAVTLALCAPVLIRSLLVLSPVTAFIESIIIDLPAPVSPVRTLNPSENSISASSIIAIFSIFSLESIFCHRPLPIKSAFSLKALQ